MIVVMINFTRVYDPRHMNTPKDRCAGARNRYARRMGMLLRGVLAALIGLALALAVMALRALRWERMSEQAAHVNEDGYAASRRAGRW